MVFRSVLRFQAKLMERIPIKKYNLICHKTLKNIRCVTETPAISLPSTAFRHAVTWRKWHCTAGLDLKRINLGPHPRLDRSPASGGDERPQASAEEERPRRPRLLREDEPLDVLPRQRGRGAELVRAQGRHRGDGAALPAQHAGRPQRLQHHYLSYTGGSRGGKWWLCRVKSVLLMLIFNAIYFQV